MVLSAPLCATCAFSPSAHLLAAGTMAGAVDASFSTAASLDVMILDYASDDAPFTTKVSNGCGYAALLQLIASSFTVEWPYATATP